VIGAVLGQGELRGERGESAEAGWVEMAR
jgi:hypothetical protein